MKYIKHIQIPVKDVDEIWVNKSKCPCNNAFAHYLWMAAPEIKWIYVEDVGSYQGVVYAIGKYKNKWFVMKDYYGSCSMCGAWGEGGEPQTLKEVLDNGELFNTRKEALNFVLKTWCKSDYETPSEEFINILRGKK